MRHWIQSVKERWKTTSPKEEEKTSDYTPGKDLVAAIRKREAEKKTMGDRIDGGEWIDSIFNSTRNYNPNNYTYASGEITIADHTTNKPTLKVDGTIEVQGRDVMKEIDEMRDALLLLKRDVDMESKYPRLKALKVEYERQLEKYKTFEALK